MMDGIPGPEAKIKSPLSEFGNPLLIARPMKQNSVVPFRTATGMIKCDPRLLALAHPPASEEFHDHLCASCPTGIESLLLAPRYRQRVFQKLSGWTRLYIARSGRRLNDDSRLRSSPHIAVRRDVCCRRGLTVHCRGVSNCCLLYRHAKRPARRCRVSPPTLIEAVTMTT